MNWRIIEIFRHIFDNWDEGRQFDLFVICVDLENRGGSLQVLVCLEREVLVLVAEDRSDLFEGYSVYILALDQLRVLPRR